MSSGRYPHSPVPADEELWPGELPFTSFGQFGVDRMDKRVFEQDVWWVDRNGVEHLISDMPDDYRRAVVWFLEDGREYYWREAQLRELVTIVGDSLLGRTGGDELVYGLGWGTVQQTTPESWLESTPLMRRLRKLTGLVPYGPR